MALVVFIMPLQALGYQFESTASYSEGDGDMTDTDSIRMDVTWYLKSVPTTDAPLAEAGFLSQTSSINYGFARDEREVELALPTLVVPPTTFRPTVPPPFNRTVVLPDPTIFRRAPDFSDSAATEMDRHTLRYSHIHKASGWFGEISGSTIEGDTDSFVDDDIEGDHIYAAFGRFVTATTTVKLYVARDDQASDSARSNVCTGPLFCIPSTVSSSLDTDTFAIGIASRYVGQLAGHYYAVSGFLQHDEVDTEISTHFVSPGNPPLFPPFQSSIAFDNNIGDVWKVGGSATWYFNRHLGISGDYRVTDTRSDQDQSYALSGRWFVNSNVELRLQFRRTHLEGARDDIDQIGLTIGGRI